MPIWFLVLVLITLATVYMWVRRHPIDELEWVAAIVFTLICYMLWQNVILEWLK